MCVLKLASLESERISPYFAVHAQNYISIKVKSNPFVETYTTNVSRAQ